MWIVGALGWGLEPWVGRNIARGFWIQIRELNISDIGSVVVAYIFGLSLQREV